MTSEYERAAGRQRSGGGRDERTPAAELARDRDDVQARRAAAGHDRHLARVDPLRDRDLADRPDDVLGRHRQGRLRGLVEAQPQRLGDVLLDRLPGGLRVERQAAAEEEVRVDPAERHRRIRHGRLEAAAPVADRPRIGPGAARPDAKQASGVDPDDRAAARSDRLDVDRADARDVADPAPAEPRLGGRADLAARDEPDVERRPARVADDEVALALLELLARVGDRRDRSHGGARADRVDGPLDDLVGAPRPAEGGRDEEVPREARLAQVALHRREVLLHERLQRRVDRRRRGSPVLPDDRVQPVRERVGHARPELVEELADAQLVRRVDDRPEQAYRHRLRPQALRRLDRSRRRSPPRAARRAGPRSPCAPRSRTSGSAARTEAHRPAGRTGRACLPPAGAARPGSPRS